jgi:hypothetical protein
MSAAYSLMWHSTDRDESNRVTRRAGAVVETSQVRNLWETFSAAYLAEAELGRTWLEWFGESRLTPSQQAGTEDIISRQAHMSLPLRPTMKT